MDLVVVCTLERLKETLTRIHWRYKYAYKRTKEGRFGIGMDKNMGDGL